jgi:hypothetical protein
VKLVFVQFSARFLLVILKVPVASKVLTP